MTQIQNSKRVIRQHLCQMALSPAGKSLCSGTVQLRWMFWSLDIEIWDLFVIWRLWFGILMFYKTFSFNWLYVYFDVALWTLNPQFAILTPSFSNPKSQIPNPQSKDPQSAPHLFPIRNPKSQIRNRRTRYTRSLNSLPNNPSGRTSSTRMIIRNARVFLKATEIYPPARLSDTPIIIPPTMAPGRLLSPP